ncbi:glycoside hydrolase family 35 protein [Streptomyces resistomycificus]|uniref:Beta-galactosidase n=1 Tax=Streptomyces resistomycificus TaxID=67356 RepID=A0A0L8LCK9_9ACTN|nr:beta-galactosidase family protein [Streptomyces resistomycificus]KOG35761.1 beta-galactosidase [Streptomyces resistomycificus]KUN93843.1 beta-galactosidase [Streptomyces resistomycificus]
MGEFTVGDTDFLLDGRPVRLLSGALHYFRVHEAQWGHRLAMLRAMGLNCVETYVPWNLHEPRPGEFRDVAAPGRFLDAAREAGLWAIVRPGPYICAEWDNGGLPHWLTGHTRTRDERFLRPVEDWFRRLLPEVVSRQADRGGPVVMVQVENEYGSYGSDARYPARLAELLRSLGVTVPLCTSDGPEDHMLTGGSLPGVLATVNFGSHAREAFASLRRHRPGGPLMCMELWCGWFDHWGGGHVVRDAEEAAATLREILECGASVNLYMAHGGTSFAGWAGANRGGGEMHDGPLEPDVTSYDYDAPVDEYGRPTRKFWRLREVLAGYAEGPLPQPPPPPAPLGDRAEVRLDGFAPLAAVLEARGGPEVTCPMPPTFEELGVDRGVVRYEVTVPGPRRPYPLTVRGLRDLAVVYVDGERAGVLTEDDDRLGEPVAGHARVELWVESLGRVNYGPRTGEPKGITGGLLHERQFLHGVRARGLRLDALDDVEGIAFQDPPGDGSPGLYRGTVTVHGPGDACLELPGRTRGFVWINGFNLGRYWSAGPQRSLYVPGPVLRDGTNEVWVLEFEQGSASPPALRPVPAPAPGEDRSASP